jgi:hypothetical protein
MAIEHDQLLNALLKSGTLTQEEFDDYEADWASFEGASSSAADEIFSIG